MNRDELIEAMTRALMAGLVEPKHGDRIDAQAALQAIEDAGFAVVPVEPTEAMITAGAKPVPVLADNFIAKQVYKAMIEASQ